MVAALIPNLGIIHINSQQNLQTFFLSNVLLYTVRGVDTE